MKRYLYVMVAALFGPWSAANAFAEAREKLDLRNLQDWRIVVADDAIGSETYAAHELQSFLEIATGFALEITTDASAADNIFVGSGTALAESRLRFVMDETYGEEELRIVLRADNIAIVGGRPRGTLFGVYEFLEGVLGMKFLTADHTYSPPHLRNDHDQTYTQRDDVDYRYRPRFSYRLLYYPEVLYQVPFSRRIRGNATTQPKVLKDEQTNLKIGGWAPKSTYLHNINSWADVSVKENPEYFAIKDGAVWDRTVCMSHPQVIHMVKEKVLKNSKTWPKNHSFAICQEDCQHCECDRCVRIAEANGGTHAAVTLTLVNEVARALYEVRPDVTIGTLAYAWSRTPPTNMGVEPNVRIQYATYHSCFPHGYGSVECPVNLQIAEEIRGWADRCQSMVFWTYAVDFKDYLLPPVKLGSLPTQFKLMNNSKGIGAFYQGPGGGWGSGMSDMMVYLCSRMLWNPNLDPGLLQDEFLDLHYAAAAPPIREFLVKLRQVMSRWPVHENCNGPYYAYGLNEALGREGLDYFADAMRLADSPQVRDRVEKASICAHRLAMGRVWYGERPERLAAKSKAKYRELARRIFALCQKHGVNQHRESRPIEGAKPNIRKALQMAPDEPF